MTKAAEINRKRHEIQSKSRQVRWDADAEIALAKFIDRYTRENPPPDDSQVSASLGRWGTNLLADGRQRLDELAHVEELGREAGA
jgi:hypothetical protein